MKSTSVAPWQQNHLCFSHIPKFHLSQLRKISLNCQIKDYSQTLSTEPTNIIKSQPFPDKKRAFLEQLYFSFEDPDQINHTQVGKIEKDQKGIEILEKDQKCIEKIEKDQKGIEEYKSVGFLSKMWWADLKAALGQRINVEGIAGSVSVIARDRHLVLPHVAVRDIRHIDWVALKESGFRGVVFDKDNTITAPYSLTLWPPLQLSIGQCKSVFGNNIAVFSNSAGLCEFDPDGRKARALESAIGIQVVRHRVKKPAGTAEEIEKLLGCESSKLIMVGDRPFTDIVFGNRNGFLTILTGPLSLSEEPFIVKQVRKLEIAFVNLWSNRGLKPMSHRLLTDVVQCVKDPQSL